MGSCWQRSTRMQGTGSSPARLREFAETAEQRCVELRAKLSNAEEFAEILRARLSAASQG
jgi:replicative superfamily II helicase